MIPNAYSRWSRENFEWVLRRYIAYLKEQGVRPMIIKWGRDPILQGAARKLIECYTPFRDRAVEIALELGAEVCDLDTLVNAHPDPHSLFFVSGVHVELEGAKLYGEQIARCILQEQTL